MPDTVVAGDTLAWRRCLSDYPASAGWALHYTFVSTTKVFNFDGATADGDDFAVNVPAAATKDWVPDLYRVQEYVTLDIDRYTVGTRTLRVQPDLTAAPSTGLDTRTHAQKMLTAIDAWLESKAPVAGALEINGRKISYYPLADLLKLRDRYAREVAREQAITNGDAAGVSILVRL